MRLTWKRRKKIRDGAAKLLLEERKLAMLKLQRQSIQRAVDDLLVIKTKEPKNAGDA